MYEKRRKAKIQAERDHVGSPREFVRKFTRNFRIPILGRIFRGIYNFLHVNRNITGLIGWNKELEDRVEHMESQIKNIENKVKEIHEWQLLEHINLLGKNVQEHNDRIERHEKILGTELVEVQKLVQTMTVELSNMKADFTNMHQMPERSIQNKELKESSAVVSEVPADEYFSIDYFDFENHFRGSREYVKNSLKIYVPYFADRNNVVDLGCGRGEFIELLMENGIGVRGIDLYAPFVEYCKMIHLPVEQKDMIQFLRQQDFVDGIFLSQVVEHITIEQIIELCTVAYEKLQPGCYLIMETQNPRSLAIYTNAFWIDPSHIRPVHPLTLQYIVEKQGFSDVQILYTESSRFPDEIPKLSDKEEGREHEFDVAMQRVSNLLYGSQDYAVIARK